MSRAQITLAASDETSGAFNSVNGRLNQLGTTAASVVARFAGVAAAIAAAMQAFDMVRGITQGVDALNDLKDATGSSIGNLSALEDVAARTGASMQTVGQSLVKFNQALSGAKEGTTAAEVFKRLGLSVAELKNLDPAEALRLTAVALARFADDGNKARAVQELFGKSLREVAPFLNDLAKSTELVGKVTDEQAAAAERFNQQLDALAKNSLDAKRALVGDLLPAISKVLEELAKGKESYGSFTAAILDNTGPLVSGTYNERLAKTVKQIADIRATMERADSGQIKPLFADQRAALEADIALLEKREKYLRAMQAGDAVGAGRGVVNPGIDGRLLKPESIGDVGKPEAVKQQASELEKYLQKLRESLLATQDISREEQARIDINRGLLGVLTEADKAQVLGLAGAADLFKRLQDSAKAYTALLDEGRRLTESLLSEEEKYQEQLARADTLVAAGIITWETYGRVAITALNKAMEKVEQLGHKVAQADLIKNIKKVDDETKKLAESLNDALGESLLAAFEGNTARIGDIWKNLIKRLAAQALQAQLTKVLFGDGYGVTKSEMGGAFGGVVDWFKSLGGGARAGGGPVVAGRPYLVGERGPEVIVPGSSGNVVPNSALAAQAGPTYQIVVQGDASENTLRLINGALAQFQARQMRGAM